MMKNRQECAQYIDIGDDIARVIYKDVPIGYISRWPSSLPMDMLPSWAATREGFKKNKYGHYEPIGECNRGLPSRRKAVKYLLELRYKLVKLIEVENNDD